MFGKPEWFKKRQAGWGITPVTWQGWAYASVWSGVVGLPFLTLLLQGLAVESLIWLVAAPAVLLWDVRSLLSEMQGSANKEVLYIDDNETVSAQFATRNYDFRLRR